AAGVGYAEILLHHGAGAADLVADQRAHRGQQQIMDGALDRIALSLVPRRDVGRERCKRCSVAARGGDGLGGAKDVVHGRETITIPARPSEVLEAPWRDFARASCFQSKNRPRLKQSIKSKRSNRPSLASPWASALLVAIDL